MLHRKHFHAMGCEMLAIIEDDAESPPEVLSQIPDWFETWEQTLSRFRPDSELSHLNRTFDQPVQVSRDLWEVFQASLEAERYTHGLVTPTVLDAVLEAGYDRPFDQIPAYRNALPSSMLIGNRPLPLVVSVMPEHRICLPPGLHLDFGGIAKGWAAQQTVQKLKHLGPVLMDTAGDIAISGPRADGKPWQIGIANPFQNDEDLISLHLERCGVATSGKDRRRWRQGPFMNHHIIDPRTGLSAQTDVLTATVIAPTILEAETAAKAVFILGSRDGLDWLEGDSGLAGLFVLDDGQVLTSRRMKDYL